ncbi:MAG TPA: hypothetical protein VGM29_18710, partial [Polyangiaceae bacterium]
MKKPLFTRRSALAVACAVSAAALWGGSAQAEPTPAAKAPAKALSSDEIADRVQAFYDKSHAFKAGFTQRYVVKAYGKTIDSKGQV